jgi:hypothetical protein
MHILTSIFEETFNVMINQLIFKTAKAVYYDALKFRTGNSEVMEVSKIELGIV